MYLCICMYVPIPTHIFGTVVEPHIMYETCQSGLNWNVDDVMFYTHMYTCTYIRYSSKKVTLTNKR